MKKKYPSRALPKETDYLVSFFYRSVRRQLLWTGTARSLGKEIPFSRSPQRNQLGEAISIDRFSGSYCGRALPALLEKKRG
ncbi:MAG: hypothetical protein IJB41_02115, partial [Clostridia bacterium]|nr:hypothetical protein [Clostridia bacterium]